ncbi:MAG: triose-phosphate isomerase [Ureaplasma sp.]|nr:triose-phosphate isomerase [Ureaplasma sp.]
MSKLFFINLKANLTVKQTQDYFKKINHLFKKQNSNNFVFFINHLSAYLSLNKYKFSLGIQSFFQEGLGAYTSCNTLEQLIEFKNLKYCLLGHCEELKYFNLSLSDINQKVINCTNTSMTSLICFGEDSIHDFEITLSTLLEQINTLIKNVQNYDKVILAYEPKYAVNTKFEINAEQINNLFKILKQELFNQHQHHFKICYGGNVNKTNLDLFMKQEHIDGFLIGRYGLKIENVKQMLNKCK